MKTAWGLLPFLIVSSFTLGAPPPLPQVPPGPYIGMSAETHAAVMTYKRGQSILGTSYFYWYDSDSGAHIFNTDGSDALTNHPAKMEGLSYLSPAWHEKELRDVKAAGIDFIMPVYWGVPGQYETGHFAWSVVGIPPLVKAHDAIVALGGRPPAIALFYDTSILKHNRYNADGSDYHVDLTTKFGREWFYTPIRDFFSLVPPEKWARIDGRPIVFLYAGAFAKKKHPAALDHARRRFLEDFSVECFIVKHNDWLGDGDARYQWGGAIGLQMGRDVAAIGPGYDHSAVPGRTPLVVDRRGGGHYTEGWNNLLALSPLRRPWLIHVETWNEWHEGTDIAESLEYGRQYIGLTRKYADQWHAQAHVVFQGSLAGANEVTWTPRKKIGLKPRPSGGDGVWRAEKRADADAIVSAANGISETRYLYFNADELFAYGLDGVTMDVTITYLDAGCDEFGIEYDNVDTSKGFVGGAFRPGGEVAVGKSDKWKMATFRLTECWFANRCNGADFRVAVRGAPSELAVRQVTVQKVQAP